MNALRPTAKRRAMPGPALTRRHALCVLSALGTASPGPPAAAALSLQTEPGGPRSVTLPFDLIDNRLFVQAQVHGLAPLHFIFDTGGGNILDLSVAQRLGLPLREGFSMPGAGQGVLPAWRTHVAQASVGGLRMRDLPFVVLPFQALRQAIGFEHLDGLIGHEVLRRFVVKLDFVRRRITLSEPDQDPGLPPGTTELPIDFTGNLPHVAGWVDGRAGRLAIDSGDRSSLTLFTPFVDDNHLRQAYPRRFAAMTGWGVGGPLPAEVTQVQELLLGPVQVLGVTTRMPTGRGGVFATREVQGSVGTGVLKRLDVTFDYSRRRVLLASNAHKLRPDPVDHSGLWLSQGEGAFVVAHVSANSPASSAGLREGDLVLAVNGRPAADIKLPELRQRWAEHGPGLQVRLQVAGNVSRGGDAPPREHHLVLRDRWASPRLP